MSISRGIAICWGIFFSAMMIAQETEYLQEKDAWIDSLIKTDRYPEALKEIDEYLLYLQTEGPTDSIYSLCYNAGRAYWKVKGTEAGIAKAEEINNWVAKNDPDTAHYLQTLNDMSWIYYETGFGNRCIEVDSTHLNLCKSYSKVDPETISIGYHNLGFYYMKMGDFKTSSEYFQNAVHVLDEMGAKEYKRRVQSLNGVGAAFYRMGDLRQAEEFYNRSLALTDSLEDDLAYSLKGTCLNNLMLTAWQRRDYITAKEYSEQAIAAHNSTAKNAENPWDREVAMKHGLEVYTNLALLYETLGDYNTAYQLSNYVLEERSSFMGADDPYLMGIRESMAGLKMHMGDYSEETIQEFFDYRDYCYETYGKKSFYTSRAEINIAQLHEVREEYQKALDSYETAIQCQISVSQSETDLDLADIYEQRAKIHIRLDDLESALADLQAAGEIFRASREEDDPLIAQNLLSIAEVKYLKGESREALELIDQADSVLYMRDIDWEKSSELGELGINPVLKASSDFLHATVLLDVNPDEAKIKLNSAISHLKNNKKALTDHGAQMFLYENHEKIFDMAQRLAFEEYQSSSKENGLNEFFKYSEENKAILLRNRLQNFSALSYQGLPDSIIDQENSLLSYLETLGTESVELSELFEKEKEFDELKNLLKRDYPEYYALKYSDRPTDISQVQSKGLRDDQTILIYSVVDTLVYVLLIDESGKDLYQLDAASYSTDLDAMNNALVTMDINGYLRHAHDLYEALLAPMRERIQTQQLLIIPDEELYFLNFEVLLDAVCTADNYIEHLLIQDFTISYLLSASTAMKFKELRDSKSSNTLSIAPGFTEELKKNYLSQIEDSNSVDENYLRTIQQPFALQTAINVADLMSGKSHTGSSATERNVKADASKYGIIHLGTHAEMNTGSPLLSRLVLSKDPGSDEDGYLHAYEIYEMPLRAELAVLSACETGLGRKPGSEGVMSLAHSFAYAGCPSIVMSLWGIDEKSSSEVIEVFYANLKEGQAKNTALRNAKLDFLASNPKELSFPFYWAGLVLVGDETPLVEEQSGLPISIKLIGLVLVIAVILFLILRSRKQT